VTKPRSFLDPKIIAKLAHQTLESRRAMIGSVSGRHSSPMRGSSLEFAQYRKYVPGDDTRRLDWRVWGRSDRSYIKEFEADTNLRMCFAVDASGSMNYCANSEVGTLNNGNAENHLGHSKLHRAKSIAGSLAWLAVKQGDAVGLSTSHPTNGKDIPPRRGARHLRLVLDQLDLIKGEGDCDLPARLHTLAERIPRRGLVVIVSDLFVDLEELSRSLKHLRHRNHDLVIFHLIDAEELNLPFGQPMKFVDLEGGLPLLADPVVILNNYQRIVGDYLSKLKESVSKLEIDYRRVGSDQNLADVLSSFLAARAGSRKRR
jgi:uncharacterized protein (DUF58 family)